MSAPNVIVEVITTKGPRTVEVLSRYPTFPHFYLCRCTKTGQLLTIHDTKLPKDIADQVLPHSFNAGTL